MRTALLPSAAALQLFGALLSLQVAPPAAARLALDVADQGNFSLSVGGVRWLEGTPPAVHVRDTWWSTVAGMPTTSRGRDGIGSYNATTFQLRVGAATGANGTEGAHDAEATFREYVGAQSLVFSLAFPHGAVGTRTTDSATACHNCAWPTAENNFTGCLGTGQGTQCLIEPATRFPSFDLHGGLLPALGWKTWEFTFGVDHSSGHSSSTGDATNAPFGQTIRRNNNTDLDPAGGAPVVLFDEHNGSAIVVGPLNNFMTTVGSVAGGKYWSTGVGGEIDSLPQQFTIETLVHYSSSGITDAMLGWGSALRRFHNTTRNVEDDITLSKLGYWTDNGAYFMLFDWQFAYPALWPAVKPTSEQFSTAEGVAERALTMMHTYFEDIGVPVKYWQLDAWWYEMPCQCAGRCCGATPSGEPGIPPCGGPGGPKSSNSCIANFTANSTFFPSGLAALSDRVGGAGFNLYHHLFCGADMGGNSYEATFDFQDSYVVAAQSLQFYRRIFAQGLAQRQVSFEIDYLSRYASLPQQRASLTNATVWLKGMADAAAEHHIPIQYCMQYPRHILESALHPAVTQARASTDYGAGPLNFFDFGHIALLNVALDLRPSKDNFRSKVCEDCDFGNRAEVEIEAMLACHSRGPVGISDGPGETDLDLVRRMVTTTGTILQPSRAMFAIDAHYAVDASRRPDGEVWASQTSLATVTSIKTVTQGDSAKTEAAASLVKEEAGMATTHFVLAVGNKDSSGSGYTLQANDLHGLDPTQPYLVRKWNADADEVGCTENAPASQCTETWLPNVQPGPHLTLQRQNQSSYAWINTTGGKTHFQHELWGVYPVLGNGFCLLGELNKFVPVSETRFGKQPLRVTKHAMTVMVWGDPGEAVTVTAAVPRKGQQRAGPDLPNAVRAYNHRNLEQAVPSLLLTAPQCVATTFESDVDFGGNDLVSHAHVTSAAMCCANCSATAGCQAWTWAGDKPAAGPPYYCWLKTAVTHRGRLEGHTSGALGKPAPPAPPFPPPSPPPPSPHTSGYSCAAGLCTIVPGGGAFNSSDCDHQCPARPPPPPGNGLGLRVLTVIIPPGGGPLPVTFEELS